MGDMYVQIHLDKLPKGFDSELLYDLFNQAPVNDYPKNRDESETFDYENWGLDSDGREEQTWVWLKAMLDENKLADAAIVTCQGQDGWNDYLLLYHYDPTEKLDELED